MASYCTVDPVFQFKICQYLRTHTKTFIDRVYLEVSGGRQFVYLIRKDPRSYNKLGAAGTICKVSEPLLTFFCYVVS